MSGGGASTAVTTIPQYQEDTHGLMIMGEDKGTPGDGWATSLAVGLAGEYVDNPSIMRYILEKGITDVGGNPYDGVSAFDPSDELGDVSDRLDTLQDAVDALDPDTDWDTYITKARSESATDLATLDVDAIMETVTAAARRTAGVAVGEAFERAAEADRDSIVQKARAAFEARTLKSHFKSINRFAAPMADGGAINSSAYVVGIALLEGEFEDRLAQFDMEFTLPLTREAFSAFMNAYVASAQTHLDATNRARLAEKQVKLSYLLEGTREMMNALRSKMASDHSASSLLTEANRISIVAQGEEQQANLEFDVKASGWDMELFQQAGNVLSAVHGSVVPQAGKPSRAASAIGGGLGGAAVGAQIGTAIAPGIGTGIGAGVGGLAGLIGGLA